MGINPWKLLCFIPVLIVTPAFANNVTYTYDALNRLTQATYGDGTAIQYSYDPAGNRTSHVVRAATSSITLTIKKAGTGSGTVKSNPAGITCGTTCTASFNSGTAVTLTATAASGSVFTGWKGACTGKNACTVTMDAAKTVTATFSRNTLRIHDVSQIEGKLLTFTVALSPASTRTITVKYATASGTALAGNDYFAQNGVLTFTPGQTTRTITVLSTQDTLVEADETFMVKLTAPNGAAITDNVGLGTIQNDDR